MNRIRTGVGRRSAGATAMLAMLVALALAALACLPGTETPSPPPADEDGEPTGGGAVEPASGQAIVISDFAVVRSEPDVESTPVTTLSQGDVVALKAHMPEEQWYLIDLSGTGSAASEGWIRDSFLLVGVTLTPTDTPEPDEESDDTVDIPAPVDNPTASVTATSAPATPTRDRGSDGGQESGTSGSGGTTGVVANPPPQATPTLETLPTATDTPPGAVQTTIPRTP